MYNLPNHSMDNMYELTDRQTNSVHSLLIQRLNVCIYIKVHLLDSLSRNQQLLSGNITNSNEGQVSYQYMRLYRNSSYF